MHTAPGADLRTDLPRYRVHRDGEVVDELTDVRDVWRDDLVAFLIGCSFTFERALLAAELPVRHIEQGVNVPMYPTAVACRPAGRFAGPARRLDAPDDAAAGDPRDRDHEPLHDRRTARRCTSATRRRSGSPSLAAPQYGDPVEIRDGEVPVFWACGVTPQAVAAASRPELMITHAPGHMFVTDVPRRAMSSATLTGHNSHAAQGQERGDLRRRRLDRRRRRARPSPARARGVFLAGRTLASARSGR